MQTDRRRFVKLSTLAVAAAVLPSTARASSVAPYQLPALPYAFDALEPHIDTATMEIHHDKHHAAYIKNLNVALASAPALAQVPLDELLKSLPAVPDEALRTTLRNNGGGHWNHDFFWKTLAPAGKSGVPSPDLTAAINEAFGSMEAFKKAFGEAATKRFGSGWAWLVLQGGKLEVVSTANQDNPLMGKAIAGVEGKVLLGVDVWEHAYYLKYQNLRAGYLKAVWNLVNWSRVSALYAASK